MQSTRHEHQNLKSGGRDGNRELEKMRDKLGLGEMKRDLNCMEKEADCDFRRDLEAFKRKDSKKDKKVFFGRKRKRKDL